jgi:hypothetical protein
VVEAVRWAEPDVPPAAVVEICIRDLTEMSAKRKSAHVR